MAQIGHCGQMNCLYCHIDARSDDLCVPHFRFSPARLVSYIRSVVGTRIVTHIFDRLTHGRIGLMMVSLNNPQSPRALLMVNMGT